MFETILIIICLCIAKVIVDKVTRRMIISIPTYIFVVLLTGGIIYGIILSPFVPKKDKTVKILLIIDIPPRILANVMCPHLYMLAYTITGSGAGLKYYIIFYPIFQLASYTKRPY